MEHEHRLSKLKKIGRWLFVAFLSLWALYAIAANVFLSSSLWNRVINQEPDVVWIQFERAWTIVPGHIHARKLHIQSADSNVDWILTIDRASFDVSLVGLARKQFSVSDVDGTGVSMRIRTKKPSPVLTEEYVKHLPPIPGYGRLPIRPPEPPSPAVWDDRAWDLWTIHLEDVVARDVREIWIDGTRFQGSLGASGGFYLKPIRRVEVGWIDVRIDRGTAHNDGKAALSSIHGTARLNIDGFDPRRMKPEDFVRHTSTRSDLKLVIPDVDALGVPETHATVFAEHLAIAIDRGRLVDGTHVALVFPHVATMIDRLKAEGRGRIDASVSDSKLALHSVLEDLTLGEHALHVPHAITAGDAKELDLVARLRDLHLTTTIPEAKLNDARALNVLPEGEPIVFEKGTVQAHGIIQSWPAQKRFAGHGALVAPELDVRVAKVSVRGGVKAAGSFGLLDLEQRRIEDAKLDVEIEHGHVSGEKNELVSFGGLTVRTKSQIVDLEDPLRALEAHLAIEDGTIEAKRLLAAYLPKGKSMTVDRTHARFQAEAQLVIADHVASGRLSASAPDLTLKYEDLRLHGHLSARAQVHDWKWEHGDLVLDEAAIDARKIVVENQKPPHRKLLTIDRIAIDGSSDAFSFQDPLKRADLTAQIAGGRVPDAKALNAFLPAGASFVLVSQEGTFEAELEASVTNRVARTTVRARSHALGVGGKKVWTRGDTDFYAVIDRWNLDANVLVVKDARVHASAVEGSFFTARALDLTGSATRLDLARPTLSSFDFRLVVDHAEVPDARALGPFLPAETIAIGGGRAIANADVQVSSSEETASGGIAIDLAGGMRVRDVAFDGKFGTVVEVKGWDPENERLDIAGSRIIARDVRMEDAEKPWSGVLAIPHGALYLTREPRFEAEVVLDAKDATPIVVLATNGLPKPIVNLVRAETLHATASLVVAPKLVALQNVDAAGDDIAVRGSFVGRGERKRGAFIIEKGPLSAGVKVDDAGASARLFGLEGWLDREERAAGSLLEEHDRKAKRTAQ